MQYLHKDIIVSLLRKYGLLIHTAIVSEDAIFSLL